jgi:Tfp pilus assembly protein PilP
MKLTTAILAVGMMTGGLWAQNPNGINNTQGNANAGQQRPAAKPVAGAPGKPVAIMPATAPVKHTPVPATAPAKPHVAHVAKKPAVAHPHSVIAAKAADAKAADASTTADAPKPPKPEEKKWAMSGKRDPFFSPVVQQPTGSGCSTGKKCLEIGQINVRGVVKAESGFIAVVTNSLNKAYFLRENDPVFNGYVLRITGDTVVFQETVQDKLGKPLTREVVKRIITPAV